MKCTFGNMGSGSIQNMTWEFGDVGSTAPTKKEMKFGEFQFKELRPSTIKGVVLQLKAHRHLKLMSIFNERSPPPLNKGLSGPLTQATGPPRSGGGV